jgi:hypothetical protein
LAPLTCRIWLNEHSPAYLTVNGDAKAPPFKMKLEDEHAQEIHPDWTLVVSNQLTLITQTATMLEKSQTMIEELRKISGPSDRIIGHQMSMIAALKDLSVALDARRAQWEVMTKNQEAMNAGMQALNMMMDRAIEQLGASVSKASTTVNSLMKIPIAIVVMTAASFAFLYMKEISETTWLVIMGVAVFPWLGDSIEAVMKLMGIRQGAKNSGSQSKKE